MMMFKAEFCTFEKKGAHTPFANAARDEG